MNENLIGKVFKPRNELTAHVRHKVAEVRGGYNFGGVLGYLPACRTLILQNPEHTQNWHPIEVFLAEHEEVPWPSEAVSSTAISAATSETQPATRRK